MIRRISAVLALCALGCAHDRGGEREMEVAVERSTVEPDLLPLLRADPMLGPFLDDAPRRRLQILVAIPDPSGTSLRRLAFRADAEYFYPASAVKLCAAVGALEKLDELRRGHSELSLSTPLRVTEASDRAPRTTTLRRELEKALVVSDNDAFNLLLDFVGSEELGQRMARIGLAKVRVVHHLGSDDDGPAPSFELLGSGAPTVVGQRVGFDAPEAQVAFVGEAHVDDDGQVVDGPLDFADKNRVSLRELQDLLVAVARPELADGATPALGPGDRGELLDILGALPTDVFSRSPRALDAIHKPLATAIAAAAPDDRILAVGKGGRAYGFTVANVYVADATSGRAAFVAATIYTNDNETMNDDRYDYSRVADPFVARLGAWVARTFLVQR